MPVAVYREVVNGLSDGFPSAGEIFSRSCPVAPAFGIFDPAAFGGGPVLCSARHKLCAGKQHALVQEKRLRVVEYELLSPDFAVGKVFHLYAFLLDMPLRAYTDRIVLHSISDRSVVAASEDIILFGEAS